MGHAGRVGDLEDPLHGMVYPCLLKSVVASDRSDLELGDAVVLQHSSHFCFHLRGQLL